MKSTLELFLKQILTNNDKTLTDNPVVAIFIVKKLDYKRYEISIKDKKLICVSHKDLERYKHYWCNISQDINGIITLSNLTSQPKALHLQKQIYLKLQMSDIYYFIEQDFLKNRYEKLITDRYESSNIDLAKKLILLAQEDIYSFPVAADNELIFFQFKIRQNDNLNEKIVEFYIGFKNHGPFKGIFENGKYIFYSRYDTKLDFLDPKLSTSVSPFVDISDSFLDLKG